MAEPPPEPMRVIPLKAAPPPEPLPLAELEDRREAIVAAAALILAGIGTVFACWNPDMAALVKVLFKGPPPASAPLTPAALPPGVGRLGPPPELSGPAKDSTQLWSSQAPGSSGIKSADR